jgi:hypothetical protein
MEPPSCGRPITCSQGRRGGEAADGATADAGQVPARAVRGGPDSSAGMAGVRQWWPDLILRVACFDRGRTPT